MSDEIAPIRQALAGRYEVEEEIGFGGMATVYRARDLRHPRSVALKVLRQDVGDSAVAERFLQEIRTAAGLQHPHIVGLFDSGKAGSHLFYLMPLIEGETLRARMERLGPMPLEEAVRYGTEVADALNYAHARGIVHRDIKPENVFLSAGHALVGDFGIARALDVAGFRLTETGLAIGTPLYMSPEQAFASANVDGRTDQYALGCVLYEMIAGTPPFNGASVQAVMARHTTDEVPPLSTVRAVPAALERTIKRALEKAPADRWPSMLEFQNALKSSMASAGGRESRQRLPILAMLVVGALLAGTLAVGLLRAPSATPAASELSAAIFPFEYEGDSDRAFIARGLSDDLVAALVRANLQVPDLSGSGLTQDESTTHAQIARELGVAAFVTGEVRVVENRLRVTARLTDVETGRVRWQHSFSGDLVVDGRPIELFSIQDAMGIQIAALLLPQVQGQQRSALQRGMRTGNLEAYELVGRGQQELRNITLAGAERAHDHFSRAIALDSTFADAWLGLANATDVLLQLSGRPPAELIFGLRGAIERAAQLDSLSPDAMVLRARLRLYYDFDAKGYNEEMQRALKLYSNNAVVHFVYGQDLHSFGLRDSALVALRRSAALDSTRAFTQVNIAMTLGSLGRMDEARLVHQAVLKRDSTQWLSYLDLAVAAHAEDRFEEAAGLVDQARRLQSDSPWILSWVVLCSKPGRPDLSRAAMQTLLEQSKRGYVQHVFLAHAFLAVGDRQRALDELDASMRARDRDFFPKISWGEFEELRGDPRYERIVAAAGLTEWLRSPERRLHAGRDLSTCRSLT